MAAIQSPKARDLSPDELAERAELAKSLEDEIINDLAVGRQDLWRLCQHLYEFHSHQGWAALNYDHQEDWLAQPEIGMSRADYMRCVRRWRVYVVNREVPVERLAQLDHSKLDTVIPAVQKNLRPLEDVLRDVASLGWRDLQEEYIGVRDDGASEAREAAPEGGAADLDVIEGSESMLSPEEVEAANEAEERLLHAARAVDSWLELGGDRRKAIRNWKRLRDEHPLFQAISGVSAFIDGAEGAPHKLGACRQWQDLVRVLDLNL